MTFSGTTLSGGYSEKAFQGRFTDSSVERLEKLEGLFKNTLITGKDFESLITRKGKNVFLFLEPPYYSAENSKLYGNKGDMHTDFAHKKLKDMLKVTNHKFLITYDDSEYIRSLYEGWTTIKAWDLKYGMRNVNKVNQTGKELFISNY
jgi:DNA adenine methylase